MRLIEINWEEHAICDVPGRSAFSIVHNSLVTLKSRRNRPPFVTEACISLKWSNYFPARHGEKEHCEISFSRWPRSHWLLRIPRVWWRPCNFRDLSGQEEERCIHRDGSLQLRLFQSTLFFRFHPSFADNVPARRYRASSRGPIGFNDLNSQRESPGFTRLPGALAITL